MIENVRIERRKMAETNYKKDTIVFIAENEDNIDVSKYNLFLFLLKMYGQREGKMAETNYKKIQLFYCRERRPH